MPNSVHSKVEQKTATMTAPGSPLREASQIFPIAEKAVVLEDDLIEVAFRFSDRRADRVTQ